MEGYVQSALRKGYTLLISKSALKQLLWESLTAKFCQYLQQFS